MRPSPASLPSTARCVGYVRVSTERQAGEKQTSLADQKKAIEQLAARTGLVVDRWFEDAGFSGSTAEKRPEFSALLAFCAANRRARRDGAVVLCLNDSRFGRFPDPEESTYWRIYLKKAGWVVRFCEDDDLGDSDFAPFIKIARATQSTSYRKNLQRNVRRGARGTAAQGYWRAEAPLGYRRKVVFPEGSERTLELGVRKADTEKVQLTPGPANEVAFVQWLFATYDEGRQTLGDLLRDARDRFPSRTWSRGTVAAVLKNPAYAGDVLCGRRLTDHATHEEGDSWRIPESEWYGKRDAHPALVERDLFDRVQQRLKANRVRGRAARGAYLLSGLVHCAVCGRPMVGGGGGKTERDPSGLRRFYKCSSANLSGAGATQQACPGRIATITRRILDEALIEVVGQTIGDPRVQRAIAKAMSEAVESLSSSGQSRVALADRQQSLERQRANLLDAIADETVTKAEAAPKLESIRKSLAIVAADAQRSLFAKRSIDAADRERDRLIRMATSFRTTAAKLSVHTLREWLKPWVARAEFDKHSRRLAVAIRTLPAVGAFGDSDDPFLTVSDKGTNATERKLIVRRVSLRQDAVGKRVAVGGRR